MLEREREVDRFGRDYLIAGEKSGYREIRDPR